MFTLVVMLQFVPYDFRTSGDIDITYHPQQFRTIEACQMVADEYPTPVPSSFGNFISTRKCIKE